MIRHYFPGIDIDSLSDEDFAIISNDAAWMDAHQIRTQQANQLGLLS